MTSGQKYILELIISHYRASKMGLDIENPCLDLNWRLILPMLRKGIIAIRKYCKCQDQVICACKKYLNLTDTGKQIAMDMGLAKSYRLFDSRKHRLRKKDKNFL